MTSVSPGLGAAGPRVFCVFMSFGFFCGVNPEHVEISADPRVKIAQFESYWTQPQKLHLVTDCQ